MMQCIHRLLFRAKLALCECVMHERCIAASLPTHRTSPDPLHHTPKCDQTPPSLLTQAAVQKIYMCVVQMRHAQAVHRSITTPPHPPHPKV
jgi:hypothetical protein